MEVKDFMNEICSKLAKLINIKSIISIMLTIVFCWITLAGLVTPELFITIFATVIAFYFGTQTTKENLANKEK